MLEKLGGTYRMPWKLYSSPRPSLLVQASGGQSASKVPRKNGAGIYARFRRLSVRHKQRQQDLRAESEPYLVNGHRYGGRWNAVRDDFKRARSKANGGGNVESRRNQFRSRGHADREVMRPRIHDIASGVVGDPDQRPVRSALVVIAVGGARRQAVKLGALDQIVCDAVGQGAGDAGYDRLPSRVVGAAGSIDLNRR
jgi:hypothetical protein